jgi:PmbA protein
MKLSLRDLENIVQDARRQGALGVELLTSDWTSTRTATARREQVQIKREEGEQCSVRCWVDGGREGVAVGPHGAVQALVREALEAASRAAPAPFSGPVDRLAGPTRGLGIDDRRHDQLTDQDRADAVLTNERAAARESAHVDAGPFTLHEVREHRLFANSRGVNYEAWGTTYTATAAVRLRTAGPPVELSQQIATRAFASTTCLPYGQLLAARAASLADTPVALDGPTRVLLPSRAVARLVARLAPLFALSAAEAADTLLARAEDGRLFHKRLHLVDDGLLPGGLNTWAFDDRGVPPVPLTLLREGMVDGRMVGLDQARALGQRPTGHERGGAKTPSNLQLNSGTRSVHALLGDQPGPVLCVDDLPDLSGLDLRTGALDVVVHGTVLRGQRKVGAARGVRLTGDIVSALRQIIAVASDTDRTLHVDAPALFLDGLGVTG